MKIQEMEEMGIKVSAKEYRREIVRLLDTIMGRIEVLEEYPSCRKEKVFSICHCAK